MARGTRWKRTSGYLRDNALGLVAIFIALSGTAVAAGTLGRDSVDSRAIRDGEVRSNDIADRAVTRPKIARETISGRKIEPGAIKGRHIKQQSLDFELLQRRIGADCAPGSAIRAVRADGTVVCEQGSDGTPTGPAGGDLGGTFPDPTIAASAVGTAEIGALPSARAIASIDQEIFNSTSQTVELDTLDYASDLTFNAASDSLTVVTPGIYALSAGVSWDIEPTGVRRLRIRKSNLPTDILAESMQNSVSGFGLGQSVSTIAALQAGDQVSLQVTQTSGTTVDLIAFEGRAASLSAVWLAPRP